MNWSKVSSIAEILSSAAILVTLLFLAAEMQQNTLAVQAQSLDVSLTADIQHLYGMVDDPSLWLSFFEEDLSETQKVRLFHFLAAMTRLRERDWLLYQSGALDQRDWATYQGGLLGTLSAPQPRKWWNSLNADVPLFDPGFVEYVNEALSTRPLATKADTLGVFD